MSEALRRRLQVVFGIGLLPTEAAERSQQRTAPAAAVDLEDLHAVGPGSQRRLRNHERQALDGAGADEEAFARGHESPVDGHPERALASFAALYPAGQVSRNDT